MEEQPRQRHLIIHSGLQLIQQVLTHSLILHSFPLAFLNSSLYHLGNVYFADNYNCRIRKVTVSTGIIATFAGTGTSSFSGDNGPATAASLSYPVGVGIDASGTHSPLLFWLYVLLITLIPLLDNVYITDRYNNRVRKVTVSTATSTPTTTPTLVPSSSTPTTSAPSNYPSLSPSTVYIITTIAGTGTSSYSGDNGQATSAGLYLPYGVRVDAAG